MPVPKGTRVGGRKKGTPNKSTRLAAEILSSLKCDPLQGMVSLAMDKKNTPELRGKMFSDLAQYVHPRLKSVEMSTKPGQGTHTIEELLMMLREA